MDVITPQELCTRFMLSIPWRHNERDGVSNHQPHDCLPNNLFRRRSKQTSKLRVTALCERNSPVTGKFPTKRDSNAENVSIWWRHHVLCFLPGACRIYSYFPWLLDLPRALNHTKPSTLNHNFNIITLTNKRNTVKPVYNDHFIRCFSVF